MEVQDKINALLIPMTHIFTLLRMPDLAMANMLGLITMNLPFGRDKYYLLMNGIFTYIAGYGYFLNQNPSGGVYMFLLGILCIGTSLTSDIQTLVKDWNSQFRVSKQEEPVSEYEYDSEEEEEEGSEAPEEEGSEASVESESSEAPAPTEDSLSETAAPPPVECQPTTSTQENPESQPTTSTQETPESQPTE